MHKSTGIHDYKNKTITQSTKKEYQRRRMGPKKEK